MHFLSLWPEIKLLPTSIRNLWAEASCKTQAPPETQLPMPGCILFVENFYLNWCGVGWGRRKSGEVGYLRFALFITNLYHTSASHLIYNGAMCKKINRAVRKKRRQERGKKQRIIECWHLQKVVAVNLHKCMETGKKKRELKKWRRTKIQKKVSIACLTFSPLSYILHTLSFRYVHK